MKKLRTLFALAFMAVCAVLPITAHADTVDDICEEYGYKYRWTVEAKLDDTYDGTWLREISDNGKIRISFVLPEITMAREASRGVVVAEGTESVVIAVRNYNNANNYTEYAADIPLKQENGEWIVDEEFYDTLLYNWLSVIKIARL